MRGLSVRARLAIVAIAAIAAWAIVLIPALVIIELVTGR